MSLHAIAVGCLLCDGNSILQTALSSPPLLLPLVPKSLTSSASFTHVLVPSPGLFAGFPAPAGRARFLSSLLPDCVANVQMYLMTAVPAIPCAQQSASHVPEGLQGVVRARQANELHCGLEAVRGWQLVMSET